MAGRYRLLRTLAVGGLGRVWLAVDETLGRRVAIKKCALPDGLSAAQQRLIRGLTVREACAFARIVHPNVVRVLDLVPGEEEPWIVMEYIASRSLLQVIQESGPLPPARVAAVGLAVLNGLNAARGVGVLHLDVKPANVLIGDDGRIVLADFGPAVTDEGVRALSEAGIVLGSPKYIAPERLSGGVSTPQADLWSLGATLYHAVEGRPPYVRETVADTLKAVAESAPDPPRQAGPLAGVLAGLLRREPADRLPPSEVEVRLRRVEHRPAVPVASPPVRAAVPRSRARPLVGRMAALGTVLAVVAALGGGAAATRGGGRAGGQLGAAASASPPAPLLLPRDFRWWTKGQEFRVAVPGAWRRSRGIAGALEFRAPSGWPSVRISRWAAPPRDVVAALITEENGVRLTAYRRLRMEALPEPPNAVWEYTFRDPRRGPMHGLRRVLTAAGHTYLIEWQAPAPAWSAELPKLAVVLDSVGPVPGA
ncbi:serine/threonine-protein kinase [Actinoplanes sp. ATCC 53533]|uniref:serine/threonine-protein kinase n=1 Tax=Actinoplanes sp. ATCC 53533 TaxID=1288362 RepID=UPI001315417C|nr:serine/threonine-protein kinase [Actinoplanes sp. ATCC 53533]